MLFVETQSHRLLCKTFCHDRTGRNTQTPISAMPPLMSSPSDSCPISAMPPSKLPPSYPCSIMTRRTASTTFLIGLQLLPLIRSALKTHISCLALRALTQDVHDLLTKPDDSSLWDQPLQLDYPCTGKPLPVSRLSKATSRMP